MKLFVWNNPYEVWYGSSMVFAVAETLEAAKEIACSAAARWFHYVEYEQDRRTWPHDLGDPLRVVDLPCAEWHHWEE